MDINLPLGHPNGEFFGYAKLAKSGLSRRGMGPSDVGVFFI
jgi:hypothetical protein